MAPLPCLLLAAFCVLCLRASTASARDEPPFYAEVERGYLVPYTAGMPEQIAIDRLDNLYLLDFENGNITMMDISGNWLRAFTTDSPRLYAPMGVAVDLKLNVYCADSGNSRIVKWDASGNVVQTYGGEQYMSVAVDAQGAIYAFIYLKGVVKMDQQGNVLQRYNQSVDPIWGRGGIALDCAGDILVSDMWNARAMRYDSVTGALLNVFTTSDPPLNYPWNINAACSFHPEHVFIADGFGGRVVEMDYNNTVVATYGCGEVGVAFSSKGDIIVAAGCYYNAVMINTSVVSPPKPPSVAAVSIAE